MADALAEPPPNNLVYVRLKIQAGAEEEGREVRALYYGQRVNNGSSFPLPVFEGGQNWTDSQGKAEFVVKLPTGVHYLNFSLARKAPEGNLSVLRLSPLVAITLDESLRRNGEKIYEVGPINFQDPVTFHLNDDLPISYIPVGVNPELLTSAPVKIYSRQTLALIAEGTTGSSQDPFAYFRGLQPGDYLACTRLSQGEGGKPFSIGSNGLPSDGYRTGQTTGTRWIYIVLGEYVNECAQYDGRSAPVSQTIDNTTRSDAPTRPQINLPTYRVYVQARYGNVVGGTSTVTISQNGRQLFSLQAAQSNGPGVYEGWARFDLPEGDYTACTSMPVPRSSNGSTARSCNDFRVRSPLGITRGGYDGSHVSVVIQTENYRVR